MATSLQQKQCESPHYHVGAIIDERYKLVDFVGAGGMACVYRAKEIGTPHEFAFKFLKDQYHNMPYLLEYFEDEASSMRDLAHPNIVRFFRFVNYDDYSYIIMEYIDGFSLSDVLKLARNKNTPMPLDEVVRVITQIARALDAIHRDDFVHRDIKPSNVLIERKTGQSFLTDLGITSLKNTRMEGAGTVAYMSPEQSETWVADHRSDVYAFGILIFEMLTGKRPFNVAKGLSSTESEMDMLRKHKEAPVPNVTDFRKELPKELNNIIAKSMAKDPDERYQSVIEFAQDVHVALKPKLSDDLHDFSTIQHRQIVAPDSVAANNQNSTSLLVAISIAILLFAGFFAFSALNSDNSATSSPQPTLVPTANPIESVVFRVPILNNENPFSEPDSENSMLIVPNEGEAFNYLRVGFVDGFRVVMDIGNAENATNFGLAFRMRDDQNYYYVAVNAASNEASPTNFNWVIYQVRNGTEQLLENGNIADMPGRISVAGIGNFFEIYFDSQRITFEPESNAHPRGSIAIYLEAGQFELSDIQISLLGDDGRTIAGSTPTPTIGLADPLRFLRADIESLIASNLRSEAAVNCPNFIQTYDSLDRHLESENDSIRNLADRAIDDGEIIYEICDSVDPDNEQLDFEDFLRDYNTWQEDYDAIYEELTNSS